MTYHDIYVGDLTGFKWGKNITNNVEEDVPTKITHLSLWITAWNELFNMVDDENIKGEQTGWGTWVIEQTKDEILQFMKKHEKDVQGDHLKKAFQKELEIVEQLDNSKKYCFIIQEL